MQSVACGRRFALTAVISVLFGVARFSNGAFAPPRMAWLAPATSLAGMAYLWLMMSGFDPPAYRGLARRIALLPAFGWYTFAVLALRRMRERR